MAFPTDDPSTELHQLIRDSIIRSLAIRRPLLHHLNADTSWLLQIPRPASAIRHSARIYYNILIDPWLTGGQSDFASSWFSQKWHATPSAVSSITAVDELAREIELLGGETFLDARHRKHSVEEQEQVQEEIRTFVDAVAISHEFTDHCHKNTLLTVDRDVPVFATEKAATLIRSWGHFRDVHTVPPFTSASSDWRANSLPPLPEWLSISRIVAEKDTQYSHSALVIAFNTTPFTYSFSSSISAYDAAEVVIYTPHGVTAEALAPVSEADPPLHTLALIHGLHDVAIGSAQQLNLGAHNGLRAQRLLNAKYWVGTHDAVNKAYGLVSWFLRRKVVSIEEAVAAARKLAKDADGDAVMNGDVLGAGDEWDHVKFEEIGNGESRILE
jgi:hypothetical protein